MYNAHWIHSLPYSKFIELTLVSSSDVRILITKFCVKFISVSKENKQNCLKVVVAKKFNQIIAKHADMK